jgi:membrane protease YdiL (CAAX protease family)
MAGQLLIVASTFLMTYFGLGAIGIAYAGPYAVAAGMGTLWLSQRRQAWSWESIGLGRPTGAARLAGQALLALFAGWAVAAAGMLLATRGFGWAPMDVSRFDLAGNLPRLLTLLAISWSTAAIGEEVLFRGFLQTRLRALLGAGRHAGLGAVLLQAMLFGAVHAYQGPTGILTSGLIGLVFGALMLRFRNVWPLVIAHGLIDTVAMLALYAGLGPR